jgi:hypothetical protein
MEIDDRRLQPNKRMQLAGRFRSMISLVQTRTTSSYRGGDLCGLMERAQELLVSISRSRLCQYPASAAIGRHWLVATDIGNVR